MLILLGHNINIGQYLGCFKNLEHPKSVLIPKSDAEYITQAGFRLNVSFQYYQYFTDKNVERTEQNLWQ